MSGEPIRVAVIGVGAFGRNHARVFSELAKRGDVGLTGVVDSDVARAAAVAGDFATRPFASVSDLLSDPVARPQAASVAVPTAAHLSASRELMEAGVDVLIEKPLAPSLEEADEIIRIAQRTGRIAQVGQLERFNPAVQATLPLVTRPLFFEVHRLSVFTPRSLDVDVVLDLMIHDIDVVLSLVRSPVKEIRSVGLPVLTPKVDIANVRMEFDSGCVANFTASRVSTERVRKLRFFQPHEYVSIDYTRQDVVVFSVDMEAVAAAGASASVPLNAGDGGHPSSSAIKVNKPKITPIEPLKAELLAFLESVRSRTRPVVPLEDGRKALAVALDVLTAIREHSRKLNLEALGHR
ncbi:MAG: Gfo/Idh/MocA family oxidoreductase [Acidobacteriales bacterium]|nr:Gfo/Idh/MocA family oxidoreductase [Terriglobales bacterium]